MVETTSTAGKNFQMLHKNDKMCASLILAIRKDDADGVDNALDAKDLIVDDLNLTDDEMKAFMKGFLSTGELDVTLWEGYYETAALSNGDVYAMFIVSNDNKVYWGLKKDLLAKFTDYSVTYTLPTDGHLKFSTSAGDVSLLFSRDYDFDKGTLGLGKFTGKIGTTDVSGAYALPPLPTRKTITTSTTSTTTSTATTTAKQTTSFTQPTVHVTSFAAADDATTSDDGFVWTTVDCLINWDQTYGGRQILAICTLLGGLSVAHEVWKYIRKRCADETTADAANALDAVVTSQQDRGLAMVPNVPLPEVDWAEGSAQRQTGLEQTIAGNLRTEKVDTTTDNPDAAIQTLRESTHRAVRDAFTQTAEDQLETSVKSQTETFKIYENWGKGAKERAERAAKPRAAKKLAGFKYASTPAVFDPLTGSVFYDARGIRFGESYEEAQKALPQASIDAEQAKKTTQAMQDQLTELDNQIEEEKNDPNETDKLLQDQERRRKLSDDLEKQKEVEKSKQAEKDELQDHVDHDSGKKEDAEKKAADEKKKWKETAEAHGV